MNTAARIAERVLECVSRIDETVATSFVSAIGSGRRAFLLGAGRSGLAARSFATRLRQMGLPVFVVGSATCVAISTGDLLVIVSGSGGKATHRELSRVARAAGATVALVTAESSAPLTAEAEIVVRIPSVGAGEESELNRVPHQPLNSLFEQAALVFLDAVVVELMLRLQIPAAALRARHANLE